MLILTFELYNAFAYTGIFVYPFCFRLTCRYIYGMLLFYAKVLFSIKQKNKSWKNLFYLLLLFGCLRLLQVLFSRKSCHFILVTKFGRLIKSNNKFISRAALLVIIYKSKQCIWTSDFKLSYLAMLGLFIFTQTDICLILFQNIN